MTKEEAIRILASSCIPGSKQTEALETLIPELKESEDKRMMREFNDWLCEEIECLQNDLRDEEDRKTLNMLCYVLTKVKDWLEKQKDLTTENIYKYSKERMSFWNGQQKGQKLSATINGETIPTENYSVDIPLAEWSDDDSDNLERIENYLWMLDDYVSDDCAMPQGKTDKIRENIQEILLPWLKSLPKRFNLQPKQEWSDEEYGRLFDIEHYLDGTLQLSPDRRIACINFLKSLYNF